MEQSPSTTVPPTPLPPHPLRKARRLDQTSRRWNKASLIPLAAALIVLIILVVPPIQLFARISWLGCEQISPGSPTVFGPDGLYVSLDEESRATLRLRMSSIPQEKWPAAALRALPAHVTPLGPLYETRACGTNQARLVLNVPAPIDAASADMTDLISWDGNQWQWVSGHADLSSGAVVAHLDSLPPNVLAVQTEPLAPVIQAEIPADAPVPDRLLADTHEISVNHFVVAEDGSLQGDPSELPAPFDDVHAMFAVVRNSAPNVPLDPAIIEDILADAKQRAAHIKAVTEIAVKSHYAGIVIDYQGITPESRANMSRFVAELAASLHKHQKQLVVVVPPPTQLGGEWNTDGYDWQAIGAAADVVQLDAPTDPAAYGPSRRAEKMLRWATGEVHRAKLQLAFSTSSIKQTGNLIQLISYEESLKPFKAITSPINLDEVVAGTPVQLSLGDASDLQYDANAHMYRYIVTASTSTTSTIWINTGAALGQKLSLPLRFGLRGVTIRGLTDPHEPGMWTAIEQYQAQALAALPAQLQVKWTVRGPDGAHLSGGTSTLTDTTFVWTAPQNAGRFTIAAALPNSATRGETTVNVVQPTPTPSPTPTPQVTLTPIAGGTDKCPDAKYVADVTVPDGTKFDKGKEFTKTWKVRNVGTCDWPEGTVLAHAGGEKMGAPDTVKVGAVKVGETKDISVPLKSPDSDGNFEAMWRLMDERGNIFGEKLTVVIVSGQPQDALAAALPAVAPVTGGSFELGGHVQGLPVSPMKQAGMKWIKVQVHHGDIPAGSISAAHNSGFKILLGTVGDKNRVMSPAYQSEFAQWLAALASAGADAIEVWNEPNIDHEWPVGQINGANYAALLAKAYPAIKNANPNTLVISAALAPTGYFAGGCQANGCNDDVFLSQMAQAGASRYMDCVGAHHNAGATSPSATSGHPADDGTRHYSWYFWPTLNLYYNSGGGRKVCFTEFGYLSGEGYPSLQTTAPAFAWASNVTVAQQAAWLAEAVSLAANSGKVRLMIIWNVDFTYYGSDPQAGYAIVRPGGSCPACTALGQVMGAR